MSTKQATRRRDSDPVRVYKDGRLAYWTGGRPNVGERKFERCGSEPAAQERATEIRTLLASGKLGNVPAAAATMTALMRAWLEHARSTGIPEGTIRAYKSDWNRWIGKIVGDVICREAELRHWTAVFDHLAEENAPRSRPRAVARTMNALVRFGLHRGFFTGEEGFASAPQRPEISRQARKSRERLASQPPSRFRRDLCPTESDVNAISTAFEEQYPGYGRRFVLLTFGSGLRFTEVLALRPEHINLEEGTIAVTAQLDRYKDFPETRLPKGNKTRTTILWNCYNYVAESLVNDAKSRDIDNGWLFPRHRSKTKWADQAAKLFLAARDSIEWEWTHHWLRHSWATWNLAPQSIGGYGFDIGTVSKWLGHSKPSTTQDFYIEPLSNSLRSIKQLTNRLPGQPSL